MISKQTRSQQVFDTEHPVAFITGSAADRVGRHVALLLLDHGYRVAFHAHRPEPSVVSFVQSLEAAGQAVMLCTGAIEVESNVTSWLDQIVTRWNRVDVVVNSAAIWDMIPLEQTTVEDLNRSLQINAVGNFLIAQRFGLAMANQASGGAIVQIGDWAVQRPYANFAAYFLSKGSIETMTRCLAVELATRNPRVRVNAILPGPVLLASEISTQREATIVQQCLLKRAGTALDVAEAALFLATSPFITGVCLPVDGGRSIYASPGTDSHAHPKFER